MTHLECSLCSKIFEAGRIWNLCECGGPLLVRYDLARLKAEWPRESLTGAVNSMWRYGPALPVRNQTSIVSLGEGMTPLLAARRTGARIGAGDLLVKDEGLNPTGSFKARGLSCAISMCVELGVKVIAIPSAGNAASALSAYAAAAGLEAHIYMPSDVPQANFIECKAYGAHVTLVDGLISDCGRLVGERCKSEGWFDISTLKEPYRIEGKKTMGYELAEQFRWTLPDAIFYPAGGGVGMIGMWKAFGEMEALGWIEFEAPQNDCGAGRRLPAHCPGISGGRRSQPFLGWRLHGGQRFARAETVGRSADVAGGARKRRLRDRSARPGFD